MNNKNARINKQFNWPTKKHNRHKSFIGLLRKINMHKNMYIEMRNLIIKKDKKYSFSK